MKAILRPLTSAGLGIGLVMAAMLLAGANADRPAAGMNELLERISKLEARVAELETERGQIRFPLQVYPLQPFPNGMQPPSGVQKQFNGLNYYMMPVDTKPTGGSKISK